MFSDQVLIIWLLITHLVLDVLILVGATSSKKA